MRNSQIIIYWYRLGFKVYSVAPNLLPKLEKEIESQDIDQIKIELKPYAGQTIFLLLSDSISYLYEKIIDPPLPLDDNFKNKLLEIIQPEIPEDFSGFIWDYKIEKTLDNKQRVIVFAPIKEFQNSINNISSSLNLNIETIETESIASFRDPNPVIGIVKKTDIKGKDEEVLNLSITPEPKKHNNFIKIIGILISIILIGFTIFSIIKAVSKKTPQVKDTTQVVSQIPTATPTIIQTLKNWADINLMVQNGTSKAGLASKTAIIFKDSGITQVETGNADNDTYSNNKLIFKDDLLKENYYNKFKELVEISDENIIIDNSIQYDVIFILGLN